MGGDGLDPDVTRNLDFLYRKLGYSVQKVVGHVPNNFSGLLVVTRSHMLGDSFLIDSKASEVVVYDYVADSLNYLNYLNNLSSETKKVIVFSTSEERIQEIKTHIVSVESGQRLDFHFSFMPVFPKIWIAREARHRISKPIHIGHFKSKSIFNQDSIRDDFLEFINRESALVGGRHWQGIVRENQLLGEINLRAVSTLYARCEISIGLMYPSQRNHTYSGRYWHAPLNGCIVLSEPSKFSSVIPGVVTYNFKAPLGEIRRELNFNSRELKLESKVFWEKVTDLHVELLKQSIPHNSLWSLVLLPCFIFKEKLASIKWSYVNRGLIKNLVD